MNIKLLINKNIVQLRLIEIIRIKIEIYVKFDKIVENKNYKKKKRKKDIV